MRARPQSRRDATASNGDGLMKAMLLRGPNLPFEPVELPDPAPGPGEAGARSIPGGSALPTQHVKAGRRAIPFPRIIGHEITAEIAAVGAGVTSLNVGDPVTRSEEHTSEIQSH